MTAYQTVRLQDERRRPRAVPPDSGASNRRVRPHRRVLRPVAGSVRMRESLRQRPEPTPKRSRRGGRSTVHNRDYILCFEPTRNRFRRWRVGEQANDSATDTGQRWPFEKRVESTGVSSACRRSQRSWSSTVRSAVLTAAAFAATSWTRTTSAPRSAAIAVAATVGANLSSGSLATRSNIDLWEWPTM